MSTLFQPVDRLGAMTQPPADLREMRTGSAQTPSLAEGRNLILTEEAEWPPAERPHDLPPARSDPPNCRIMASSTATDKPGLCEGWRA